MHYSLISLSLALTAFLSSTSASPFPLDERAASPPFPGVATFNDYVDQVKNRNQPTVCGDYTDDGTKVFAAAAGDLSPNISKGLCKYTAQEQKEDRSLCTTQPDKKGIFQQPNFHNYYGPSCPATACGTCYKVTNNDSHKSITIKIVDACPAKSAYNFCKSDIEAAGKCSGTKNALDISVRAYPFLVDGAEGDGVTGKTKNLENLDITPLTGCPS